MVANLGEFRSYLAEYLWKDDDTVLIANLPKLISMATSELNRRLNVSQREKEVALTVDANPLPLIGGTNDVTDFRQIRTLMYKGYPLNPGAREHITGNRGTLGPYYYLGNDTIYFQIASSALPLADPVQMHYRTTITNLVNDADTNFVLTDYLDLYTYTALKNIAGWVREDERVSNWAALSEKALETAIEEDLHKIEWGATPTAPKIKAWNP